MSDHACVECKRGTKRAWEARNKERVAEAQAKRARKWFLANREKADAASRKWQAANPERYAEATRAWNAANPEKVAATKQRFNANNPGIWAAYAAKRRAVQDRQTPPWADDDAIKSMYALAAIYRDFGFDVEVDHEIPLQGKKVSGLHVHHNLQIIPMSANRAKSNQFHIQ